ncbi:hypothetical protein [Parasulfitobacter algicola]|uniref:Uncharacterized protein n=1 Tax=Parasulfitobacter algicola TaxID=2614809 RepID=A0ABX2J0N2_9RHOB|nr:hypothetical protein [Sulfitobacter algicola]NSX56333.1 hypothetical protein [Sulfitobacter algicola]
MNIKASGLGLLLPVIANPTVAATIGIGVISLGIYSLLKDDDDSEVDQKPKTKLDKLSKPLENETATVDAISSSELSTVSNAILERQNYDPEHTSETRSEDERRELIRQAMSELGKRSAAARAKKISEQGETD